MLFKTRFHEGIRAGDITMTIRVWQKPQATPGKEYKLGATDAHRGDRSRSDCAFGVKLSRTDTEASR